MKKINVGIIYGGKSVEHEVSLQSANSIVKAINRDKFEPILIGVDKKGKWHLNNEASYLFNPENIEQVELNKSKDHVAILPGEMKNQLILTKYGSPLKQLDVIFPVVHGTLGEDGSIQGLLKIANLPYVGSDVLGSAICMDKDIAKRLMQGVGINVAKWQSFTISQRDKIHYEELATYLGRSMFIKPANLGSSVGVSNVSTKEEFENAINMVFEYDHKIIIEETIIGREINFALLGNENPLVSLPGEVLINNGLYSYKSKYMNEDDTKFGIPAKLNESKIDEMQRVALKAFETLQCEGLARVDFFLTDDGCFYVNEVNTLPSFAKTSIYPRLWEASGLDYSDLINHLINLAIKRYNRQQKFKSTLLPSI
ncbi:D-alanine--D-alanine ligase [Oceanobacillus jordanicus]|uniref:D-alanine--D-alanine ligase n=1 Tax=Oceanobacillus jordanicus TaxID=2867266 RepID=A0AAW5BB37_9BACI|nr:D-alanine--D-alanine ligase [Oceanobacillus jordanicus]MCG3420304.1 D-alanine--D-alanine ligase [Oceanobacillus jordanicus]